ncbi:MAG: tetratricopeptide repeat protein [Crocinitomicaceae bacterium]|nr:tetratricopeptide repeat protein [Crocinitomicaceae bacterium]
MELIHETRSTDRQAAIIFCLKAEVIAKDLNDYTTLDEIYYTLGSIYSWINHEKAIEYSQQGIALSQTEDNNFEAAKFYVLLGKMAVSTEDVDGAIHFYKVADSIYAIEEDTYNLAWTKGCLGHAYIEKKQYRKAIDLLNYSIELNNSIDSPEKNIISLVNIGNCRLELNQPDLALERLEEAYELSEKVNDQYGRAASSVMLSKYNHRLGRYSSAVAFAKEAEAIAIASDNFYMLKNVYQQIHESYKEMGNFEASLEFLELHHFAKDSLENRKNNALIADIQNSIAIKKQSFEHELLKKEKSRLLYKQKAQSSRNNLLLILLISSALIVAALIILMIYRNKGSKLKQKLQEETIKMRNREITNLAIYIKQRSMFISLIRGDLKKIRATENEKKKNDLVTEVFVKVGQYARIDSESGPIKEHIEESSQDFIARLSAIYPKLTKKEKRLAQLLRMKLSSKEIAVLLDIAPHSVDISRYRLRKKLNVKKGEDLASRFSNI